MAITITVEDGTGVANSNAYESVAATVTRLDDLGLTLFGTLTAAQQAAALFRGTANIEQRIQAHLSGRRTVAAQGLHYPRTMSYHRSLIITSTTIPEDLIMACAYQTAAQAAKISGGDKTSSAPGIKSITTASGYEVVYSTTPGSTMSTSIIDDRAAPYVRALINRRAA